VSETDEGTSQRKTIRDLRESLCGSCTGLSGCLAAGPDVRQCGSYGRLWTLPSYMRYPDREEFEDAIDNARSHAKEMRRDWFFSARYESGPGIAAWPAPPPPEPLLYRAPRYCEHCGHARGCMCPRTKPKREPRV